MVTNLVFFFNDTATTEIYTLSLHVALPIYLRLLQLAAVVDVDGLPFREDVEGGLTRFAVAVARVLRTSEREMHLRSEEHTSELQSQSNLVCRLLLEKKKLFVR